MHAAAGPWAGLAAAHSLGGAPRRATTCVLCRDPAAVYCRNDDAFLCSQCDSQVHSSSSGAAAHERCPAAAMAAACAASESAAASSLPTPTAQQLRCGAALRLLGWLGVAGGTGGMGCLGRGILLLRNVSPRGLV